MANQIASDFKSKSSLWLPVLSGLLLGLSFLMYPFIHLEPFAWVGLVPLLIHLKSVTKFKPFFKSVYISMFVFVLVSVWWVSLSTPMGGTLMYFTQTLFETVPFIIFFLLRKHLGWRMALYSLPFVWTAWEWIYLDLEISFGWITLGNSQGNLYWMIQYIDCFGVWAISFWIILFNVLITIAIENWQTNKIKPANGKANYTSIIKPIAIIFALMILPPIIYSSIVLLNAKKSNQTAKVAIIQPNIDPFAKWNSVNRRDILMKHITMSDTAMLQSRPDLLLYPETAIPYFILYDRNAPNWQLINSRVQTWNTNLITGFSDATFYSDSTKRQFGAKYDQSVNQYYDTFNSSMLISPNDTEPQVYHKMKLVPFAERVPYMDRLPFLSSLTFSVAGISSWGVGEGVKNFSFQNHDGKQVRVCGLICYESIYPGFVSEFVREGADFLTVITNDGWFSKSYGPYQHAAFAKLRCIETHRAMARCANTGISFFIDRFGRTYGEVNWWEEHISTAPVELSKELTFYTMHIDAFPKSCLIVTAFFFLLGLWIFVKQRFQS